MLVQEQLIDVHLTLLSFARHYAGAPGTRQPGGFRRFHDAAASPPGNAFLGHYRYGLSAIDLDASL